MLRGFAESTVTQLKYFWNLDGETQLIMGVAIASGVMTAYKYSMDFPAAFTWTVTPLSFFICSQIAFAAQYKIIEDDETHQDSVETVESFEAWSKEIEDDIDLMLNLAIQNFSAANDEESEEDDESDKITTKYNTPSSEEKSETLADVINRITEKHKKLEGTQSLQKLIYAETLRFQHKQISKKHRNEAHQYAEKRAQAYSEKITKIKALKDKFQEIKAEEDKNNITATASVVTIKPASQASKNFEASFNKVINICKGGGVPLLGVCSIGLIASNAAHASFTSAPVLAPTLCVGTLLIYAGGKKGYQFNEKNINRLKEKLEMKKKKSGWKIRFEKMKKVQNEIRELVFQNAKSKIPVTKEIVQIPDTNPTELPAIKSEDNSGFFKKTTQALLRLVTGSKDHKTTYATAPTSLNTIVPITSPTNPTRSNNVVNDLHTIVLEPNPIPTSAPILSPSAILNLNEIKQTNIQPSPDFNNKEVKTKNLSRKNSTLVIQARTSSSPDRANSQTSTTNTLIPDSRNRAQTQANSLSTASTPQATKNLANINYNRRHSTISNIPNKTTNLSPATSTSEASNNLITAPRKTSHESNISSVNGGPTIRNTKK